MKVKLLSRVRLLATPWTAAHQAPPSTRFSRQEYWSGVPSPSPPTTAINQFIRIRASLSRVHLEIMSPNGEGWRTFSSLSFFLSVSLFLSSSFCLSLPFTLTCEIALKSGGPIYFYLDCFCLFRKTEFKQNISVARSRWPVHSYPELIYSKNHSKSIHTYMTHEYSFA